VAQVTEVFCIPDVNRIECGMALFTMLADHDDGASSFTQVHAGSVREALIQWANTLKAPPWEGFSEEQREDILDQIDDDAHREDLAACIDDCRFLWRQYYVVDPGEKCIRVVIIKTAEA